MEIASKLRETSDDIAFEDYKNLMHLRVSDNTRGRSGSKALDHFFLQHRIKVSPKGRISFYDAMQDSSHINKLNELIGKWRKQDITKLNVIQLIKDQYAMYQLYYGTVNQFKPTIAKFIYETFTPKIGILDFSAGWGGRCLSAMAMDIPYIGIDSNTDLESAYASMIALLEPTADVKMIFRPAEEVDFSIYKYDMVFTSPPYGLLEKYVHQPEYKSNDDFYNEFWEPVVVRAWKYLAEGGYMCLNCPSDMYEKIRLLLPEKVHEIGMILSNRFAGMGDKATKKESIYVWRK